MFLKIFQQVWLVSCDHLLRDFVVRIEMYATSELLDVDLKVQITLVLPAAPELRLLEPVR